jgi:hypothetical protein
MIDALVPATPLRRAGGEQGGVDHHGAATRVAQAQAAEVAAGDKTRRARLTGDTPLTPAKKAAAPADGADKGAATNDQDALAQERQLATLARQQRAFNFMAMERGELEREQETMDTLLLARMKHDAEVLKEWIREA